MSTTLKSIAILAAISIGAATVGGLVYLAGQRGTDAAASKDGSSEPDAEKKANADVAKVAAQDGQLPSPPLALPAMKKAVRLEEENPDAFRAQYLNKRYRLIGKVASIIGSTANEPHPGRQPDIYGEVVAEDARSHNDNGGLIFRLTLDPWNLSSGPLMSAPDLAFDDLPASTRLALRPGERVDANCTLTSAELTFFFEHCQLNKISPK